MTTGNPACLGLANGEFEVTQFVKKHSEQSFSNKGLLGICCFPLFEGCKGFCLGCAYEPFKLEDYSDCQVLLGLDVPAPYSPALTSSKQLRATTDPILGPCWKKCQVAQEQMT